MTIKEIEYSLPNGFHDSYVNSINVDFKNKSLEIDFSIDHSDIDTSLPVYKPGKLIIRDLFLFAFEPPFYQKLELFPLWVTDADNIIPSLKKERLPGMVEIDCSIADFCYYFYFSNLNCFMYVGGYDAEWISGKEKAGHE